MQDESKSCSHLWLKAPSQVLYGYICMLAMLEFLHHSYTGTLHEHNMGIRSVWVWRHCKVIPHTGLVSCSERENCMKCFILLVSAWSSCIDKHGSFRDRLLADCLRQILEIWNGIKREHFCGSFASPCLSMFEPYPFQCMAMLAFLALVARSASRWLPE